MNSLIGRLVLIVTVALLPALGFEAWDAFEAQQARARVVEAEMLRMARQVGADQADVISGARQILTAVASLRAAAGRYCDTLLADLLAPYRGAAFLASATLDGAVDCAAGPVDRAAGWQGQAWFHRALARGFVVVPVDDDVLVFAQPWRDAEGRIAGVVGLGLSLAWLSGRLDHLPLSAGSVAAVLSADGEVLAGTARAGRWQGWQHFRPDPAGAERVMIAGGGAYFIGAVPLGPARGGLFIAVGRDRAAAFAGATRAEERDIALVVFALLFAIVTTIVCTRRLVHRPVRRLLDAANAWAAGDLGARTGLTSGPGEFRRLAAAFDTMAAALQARDRKLSTALESTSDSVAVFDRDWRFTFLNARAAHMLGQERELLGQSLWDLLPQATHGGLGPTLRTVAATGRPGHVEIFSPTLRRILEVHATASADGLTLFIRDVTEQRRAEVRSAEHDVVLRAIAEAIPSLVFVTDQHGRNVFVNRQFNAYSGLPPERLLGRAWRTLLHPDDVARVMAAWRQSIRRGTAYEMELRLRAADGSWQWFLARAAPLRDAGGRPDRWYGICAPIQEIVAAREAQARQGEMLERLVAERSAELKAREAELAQAQKMEAVGQLTGGVAHDFNNLLQAVSGNIELALAALGRHDVARVSRLLGNAARGIGRGARLTAQLLAFSRRQVLHAERIDARRLVEEMEELLFRAAGETVTVRTEAESGLWPCWADAAQLEAAVINLVINARDAMPHGGTVTLALANATLDPDAAAALRVAPGDYLRLEITDTGTGMPPEVLEHAFEPFFTTKDVGKGSGLGLAQVHGFVRQSGGAVSIASRLGEGARVTLWFPRDPDSAEQSALPLAVAAPAAGGATVLLVEDDPDVLDTLQFALIDAGYRVVPARDGAEAISALRSERHIDVVLSDLVLPGGASGVDVGREARRVHPGMPVLITSGHTGDMLARQTSEGEFEMLAKPYLQAELLARIAALAAKVGQAV